MSIQQLNQSLASVPFWSTLGLTAESASAGAVVLRLPLSQEVTNPSGGLHGAALLALGEAAATAAFGIHPQLSGLVHLHKASGINYLAKATADITAHARLTPEVVASITGSIEQHDTAQADMTVRLMDGHGNDVAEVVSVFRFRKQAEP